jgi:hypothetical protein
MKAYLPPRSLSARYRLGEETSAGTRGNGSDAPISAIGPASNRTGQIDPKRTLSLRRGYRFSCPKAAGQSQAGGWVGSMVRRHWVPGGNVARSRPGRDRVDEVPPGTFRRSYRMIGVPTPRAQTPQPTDLIRGPQCGPEARGPNRAVIPPWGSGSGRLAASSLRLGSPRPIPTPPRRDGRRRRRFRRGPGARCARARR